MGRRRSTYLAFMLRIRWIDNDGQPVWRISVERPGKEGELQLKSLSALCAYLTAQAQVDEEEGGDLTKDSDQYTGD